MKNAFYFYFLFLISLVGYGQPSNLLGNTWILQKVVVDNETYFTPQNDDFITTYLLFSQNAYSARGCSWVFGPSQFDGDYVTFQENFYASGDCDLEENMNFSTLYFEDFLVNNFESPFHVAVNQVDEHNFTMLMTNALSDQAHYTAYIDESISNTQWRLIEFESPIYSGVPANEEIPAVYLDLRYSQIYTYACNYFSGSYFFADENTMVITEGVSSLAECNPFDFPGNGTFDQAYISLFFQFRDFDYEIEFSDSDENIMYLTIQREDYLARYISENLSVNDLENKNTLRVYPNPVFENLYIEGVKNSFKYLIFDLNGKLVLRGKSNPKAEIPVENLSEGIYILKMDNQSVKFIKK